MKKVTVIIPAYNEESRIEKSLTSVTGQSYKNLEIIVVDDGSVDGTLAVVSSIAEKDERIRIIHKEKNAGVSAARNTGLAAATGDYICWLDGDDWLEPSMVESLVQAAEESGAEVALTNYQNIYSETDKRRRYLINGDLVLNHDDAMYAVIIRSITPSLCANIALRSLYEGIVFPEGKLFEDVLRMYQIYDRARKVVIVDRVQMNRLNRPNSLSSGHSIPKRLESIECYLEKWADLYKRYPQWEKDFISENYRSLITLRSAVLHSDGKTYREYSDRIKAVTRYFREHGNIFPGKQEGLLARIEHTFLTSGSRAGFIISWIVGCSLGRRKFVKKCKTYRQPEKRTL